ncbi:MAG: hypothetical protein JSS46_02155 [Proteobacteria bacterium]|jgi:hypothetical protein|nr:hypothetical protein [Pseudomonadota bacterium]
MSRKRKKDTIVHQYLERISGRVLDDYPGVIRRMFHGRSGVYALYKGDRLYYVGLANNLINRVKHHLKDRHRRKWDRFSVYITTGYEHIKPLESLVLRVTSPPGNHVSGRLVGAQNLLNSVNHFMSQTDADRRAMVLGGKAAQRRRRAKAAGRYGTTALQGAVERRITLIGYRKKRKFRASLRRDGHISYKGRLYESPSAAARAALGRGANGWSFWTFQRRPREWVRLRELTK